MSLDSEANPGHGGWRWGGISSTHPLSVVFSPREAAKGGEELSEGGGFLGLRGREWAKGSWLAATGCNICAEVLSKPGRATRSVCVRSRALRGLLPHLQNKGTRAQFDEQDGG